jgi:hypothetical protein
VTSILEVLWVEDQIHQRAAFNRTPSSRPDPLARAFVATLRGMGRGFPQSPGAATIDRLRQGADCIMLEGDSYLAPKDASRPRQKLLKKET